MKIKISPIDQKILQCIANVLAEKPTLVRLGRTMFDSQFHSLLSLFGITNVMIGKEIDYLEDCGYLSAIPKQDRYRGNTTHYVLTEKGRAVL